jgi:hypothetical protein
MKKNIFFICLLFISGMAIAQPINNLTFSTNLHIDTANNFDINSNYKLVALPGNDGYVFSSNYDDFNYDQTFYLSRLGFDGAVISDTVVKFDETFPESYFTYYNDLILSNGSLYHTATSQNSNALYYNAPFVFNTDFDGNVLWNKVYNNDTLYNGVKGSFATADGGLIVHGYSDDYNNNIFGSFILKTDANGNLLWSKYFRINQTETSSSVDKGCLLADGSYLFAGNIEDNGNGINYVLLMNIDANGDLIWTKNYEFDAPLHNGMYASAQNLVAISNNEAYLVLGISDPQTESSSTGVMNINQIDGSINWFKTFKDSQFFNGSNPERSFVKDENLYVMYFGGGGALAKAGNDNVIFGMDRNGNQLDAFTLFDQNLWTYETNAFVNTNDNGMLMATRGDYSGHHHTVLYKTDSEFNFPCMDKTMKPMLDEVLGAVLTGSTPEEYIDLYMNEVSYNSVPYNEVVSYTENSCLCALSVKGNVYKSSTPAENTEVAIYYYDSAPGQFSLYATTLTDVAGFYQFEYVPEGNFIIKANTELTNYVPTFYNATAGQLQWDSAQVVTIGCDSLDVLYDINLLEQFPQVGTGVLSGYVYELEGYNNPQAKRAPGEPIPDIDITVDQSPGGAVSSATTDVNGYYEFTGLNNNATFIVRANIPGLPNDSVYTIFIDLTTTNHTTLDFWVDSVGVYILADTATGINNTISLVDAFEIAPNPASDVINLLFNSKTNSITSIAILNTLGEEVYQIQSNVVSGSNRIAINLKDLANGVYFIQLNDGVHQQTKKLIKQTR